MGLLGRDNHPKAAPVALIECEPALCANQIPMIALDPNGPPIFPYFLTFPRLSCNYFTGGLDSPSVQVITEFVSTSLSAPNTQILIKLAQRIPSHPVTRRIDYPSSAKGHFWRQKSMAVIYS